MLFIFIANAALPPRAPAAAEQAAAFKDNGNRMNTPGKKLRYHLYVHGRDFAFDRDAGEIFKANPDAVSTRFFCANVDEKEISGLFAMVDDPQNADFILFPYDIGALLDALGAKRTVEIIHSLSYFKQYENKHVFFDYADSCTLIKTTARIFKIALHGLYPDNYAGLWYETSQHVSNDHYRFKTSSIKHHVSFVGVDSNPIRKLACMSVLESSKLNSAINIAHGVYRDNVYFPPTFDPETAKRRQRLFRESLKSSLFSLCPPGLGPQTVRFYETLYYGRLPVLISDAPTLPFEDVVDYSEFVLTIPTRETLRTAEIILDHMNALSPEAMERMCLKAYKTYQLYFKNSLRLQRLAAFMADHLARYC